MSNILHYVGSKSRLIDFYCRVMPAHKVWVDAFGGTGIVTVRKPRVRTEWLNDKTPELIALLEAIKNHPEELKAKIWALNPSKALFLEARERLRARNGTPIDYLLMSTFSLSCQDPIKNMSSFRDSVRFDKALREWRRLPLHISQFSQRLQHVNLSCGNWDELLEHDSYDTLFFLDPPYVGKNCYSCAFSEADHYDLVRKIKDINGKVILCGYANHLYDGLGWRKIERHSPVYSARLNRITPRCSECVWVNF